MTAETTAGGRGPARAYFTRESATRYRPSAHVSGAWNPHEQHIAPAVGLLTHAIEADRDHRRDDGLQLSRLSCDILGTLPLESVEVSVDLLRPGRTIELVEAKLTHQGRTSVLARAWLTRTYDTTPYAGTPLPDIPPPHDIPAWDVTDTWPGGFVRTLHARRTEFEPGRAVFWLRSDLDLVTGEAVSPTAAALALVDVANGMTPRVATTEATFPDLDLTAHLIRTPRSSEWVGFQTSVSFGPSGAGLTHSTVHDPHGPFAVVSQTLTVRPR